MNKFLKKRAVYHTLIWVLVLLLFIFVILSTEDEGDLIEVIIDSLAAVIPIFSIVYLNFFIKKKFLDQRKYLYYVISLILLVVLGVFAFLLMQKIGYFGDNTIVNHFINIVFVILTSTGLQYLKRGIINQYQLQELKVKTVENELNALKAQLNPHFLFNTLNNIYGMNQLNPTVGSEMILELSSLMRYHLDSSKTDLVPLKNELELLDSYIKLENLRLPDLHQTKHGTHSTKESFVKIDCEESNKQFTFRVSNSIFNQKNTIRTYIGLENTKRRLELIYGKNYLLKIEESNSSYQVTLILNLSK